MWPQAKRSVSDETAQRIAKEAMQRGAIAVGVFVDEDAETINSRWAWKSRKGDGRLMRR